MVWRTRRPSSARLSRHRQELHGDARTGGTRRVRLHDGCPCSSFFFLNDRPPPEISPLPLHAALPTSARPGRVSGPGPPPDAAPAVPPPSASRRDRTASPRRRPRSTAAPAQPGSPRPPCAIRRGDRKSTCLNSSHLVISYAVFCLKKKK